MTYLRRRLKEAGASRWPEIATATGISPRLPAKLARGERTNPRINTIQPLLDWFQQQDQQHQ